jgi:hypothetical protein
MLKSHSKIQNYDDPFTFNLEIKILSNKIKLWKKNKSNQIFIKITII